jgi:exonuclease SbcC
MLKQLEYSVTFPSTGRTLSEAVLFQGGFGAIVGPNESGKSMIIEMIRYCLFGTAALRGAASDYKNLKASLSWSMKGSDYRVERTIKDARLFKDEIAIAVGTTPVNQKIPTELGFGLAVFDMSCAANQNQILKLGEMKPAERQRAVDSVIGVSVLDDLAKLAGDEATALRRTADAIESTLREPVEPVEPADYENSGNLEMEKDKLDLVRSKADQLRGWLANEKTRPVEPVKKHTMDAATLQIQIDAQNEARIKRQTLQAELDRIPTSGNITIEQIEADEAAEKRNELYEARRKFLSMTPRPEYRAEEITEMRHRWIAYRNHQKIEHLEKQRTDLLAKGHHECPSCTHQWPVAGDAIATLDLEIQNLKNLPVYGREPATSEAELDRQQRLVDNWSEDEWHKHLQAPTSPSPVLWTVQDRARHRLAIEGRARRAELEQQISGIVVDTTDYAGQLREVQMYEVQLQNFKTQVTEFEAWLAERADKMIELDLLTSQLTGYEDLLRRIKEANLYENQMLGYGIDYSNWAENNLRVAEHRVEADDWNKVKDALKILRLKIKQHLVPSLNRVASQLITHMTGGQRQSVVVDEEFNILVDGQAIDTLSGSGAAVANLSLRFALGQVLTNNVFSLFMGDEIDASMDKDRADQTASVIYTLKERISQILLVSHKFPAADYYIAVGENIGNDVLTH